MSGAADAERLAREHRLFGLELAERLRRQIARAGAAAEGKRLVARRGVAVSDETLAWLLEAPGRSLAGADSAPLIAAVEGPGAPAVELVEALPPELGGEAVAAPACVFSRKLRKRQPLLVLDLETMDRRAAEWALFRSVYKDVTDLVTRYLWPWPAFHATRLLARGRVTPNSVTLLGLALTVVAALFFWRGEWLPGLIAAWLMTFLDTVDGKLARVTVTSTVGGDRLDHANDYLHPPVWWIAVAAGLVRDGGGVHEASFHCGVILAFYAIGRATEFGFKARFGFNQYMWRPFDRALRLVVARRNILLLLLTAGALSGRADAAYGAMAVWSLLSIGLQVARWGVAELRSARGRAIETWMA